MKGKRIEWSDGGGGERKEKRKIERTSLIFISTERKKQGKKEGEKQIEWEEEIEENEIHKH